MRAILSLVISLQLVAFAAPAEQHDHLAMLKAYLEAHSSHGVVIPQPESVNPTQARTFNMVARSFAFDLTPSAFTVEQGDVVTINLSVPSNDQAVQHGLLMETYVENAVTVNRGQTRQIIFTATTAGNFQFACSVVTCGTGSPGHFDMFGTFFVRAVVTQAPQVSSLNPNSGPTAGGTTVTITGATFQSNATVKFGGVAATSVTVGSSTTIFATTPAHAAGAVDVLVTNPDAQSSTLTNGFTYVVPPPPAPTIASITPGSGSTSGNTLVTITGTNFRAGATVTIGGVPATNVTVVNATTITAMTPLGPTTAQLADKDVVVTNSDTTKATLAAAFDYTMPPLAVALITPSVSLPAGGSKISISGAGFTTALPTTITIGGVAATNVQVVDAVTLTATAPAHAVGPVDVVVNVGGTAVTAKGSFAYVNALPKRRAARH
ncbi:MAG: IPT/TIG domain-containing protein [Acidobacteriota bacterium]